MRVKIKNQILLSFAISVFFILACGTYASCSEPKQETDEVLKAAENTFLSMKKARKDTTVVKVDESKKYLDILSSLTAKSRETIINDVYKEERKAGFRKNLTIKDVENDFSECREMCVSYWFNFLVSFNPEMVLSQSNWDVGFVKGNKAEIIITYKTAQQPAKLRMFKENGMWKTGLVETFWARK